MKNYLFKSILFTCFLILIPISVLAQFPPDTQLTFRAMPTGIAKPEYLKPIKDSIFGTQIKCISDEKVFGPTNDGERDWYAPYRRHRWFKVQPFNSNGTKILMDLTYPPYLVNGKTYKFIKRYDPKLNNRPAGEPTWSNTNPNILYCVLDNTFIEFDVNKNTRKIKHTFAKYNTVSIGLGEGNLSNNDNFVALYCTKDSLFETVVYDIKADSVFSTFNMTKFGINDYSTGVNWVSVSQTGKYVAILWQRAGKDRFMGLELFDNKMNFIRQIYSDVSNGSIIELGLDLQGNDIAVYQDQQNYDIITDCLKDAKVTMVLSGTKVSAATTISCRNIKRQGWAYLSDFEAGDEAVTEGWSRGKSDSTKASYNLVFALKLDGSQTVEIFGHEHHSKNGGLYFQPMAVPDPTGKKVVFSSDWENTDETKLYEGGPFKTARVYDYVVEYKIK